MNRETLTKSACAIAAISMFFSPVLNTAYAGVISTERAVALESREDRIEQIQRVLAEDTIRNALVQYGVDPKMAVARVQNLSDAELILLQSQFNRLPVGSTGVVEVVGIVAIVIIILELLGVTDVFKKL